MHFLRTRRYTVILAVTFSLKYQIFQGKQFLCQLNAVNSVKGLRAATCPAIFSSPLFKTNTTYVKICEVGPRRNNFEHDGTDDSWLQTQWRSAGYKNERHAVYDKSPEERQQKYQLYDSSKWSCYGKIYLSILGRFEELPRLDNGAIKSVAK